jgi:hypothetical protein
MCSLKKKIINKNLNINELLEMVGPVKNDYEEGKIYLLKIKKNKKGKSYLIYSVVRDEN